MNDGGNGDARRKVEDANEKLNRSLNTWEARYMEAGKEGREDMSGFNRVVMMGRLTRDPRLRQTSAGLAVADIGLATTERFKGKDGASRERTCFVDIVAWGRQAETCGQYLKKGAPALVEGRLQLDRWEDSDGNKRSRHRVNADRVHFLSGNGKASEKREERTLAPVGAAVPAGLADEGPAPF